MEEARPTNYRPFRTFFAAGDFSFAKYLASMEGCHPELRLAATAFSEDLERNGKIVEFVAPRRLTERRICLLQMQAG
jgi:hypothetical protein